MLHGVFIALYRVRSQNIRKYELGPQQCQYFQELEQQNPAGEPSASCALN
jgi:hypothetical protein